MENNLSLNIDELINEYNKMNDEIQEIDTLYNTSKELLENNSRGSRSNFVFVANQTSNLISIKNHKLNLLKNMNDIKKSIIDLKMKEFNIISKNGLEGVNSSTKEIADEIFAKLISADKKELIDSSIKQSDEESNNLTEEDIDKLLEARIEEDNKKNKKEETKKDKKKNKYHIVIEDSDNTPLIIDDDYNLIDDDNDEDYKELLEKSENIVIVDFKEEEDTKYAIDSEGNTYEVVSVSDD